MKSLFHVSYHVTDLETSRNFYGNILGCKEGRTSELMWITISSVIRFRFTKVFLFQLPVPVKSATMKC